jgi:hypothetical protein
MERGVFLENLPSLKRFHVKEKGLPQNIKFCSNLFFRRFAKISVIVVEDAAFINNAVVCMVHQAESGRIVG